MQQIFSSKQTEQTRVTKQIEQNRLVKMRQKVENVRVYKVYLIQQEQWKRNEQTRLLKKQQQIDKKVEKIVITKIKTETFACKRCSVKFSNNIKFHQHICDHHTKKSKSVVSNSFIFSFSFFTSFFRSILFSFDSSKFATQSKILFISFFTFSISIISFFFTSKRIISSKRSSFSNFASEFVSKRSKNASQIYYQKLVTMRSTFFCNLLSKFYFTIDDLFSMFVEKFMKTKLFAIQNSFFFQTFSFFVKRALFFIFYQLFRNRRNSKFSHQCMFR